MRKPIVEIFNDIGKGGYEIVIAGSGRFRLGLRHLGCSSSHCLLHEHVDPGQPGVLLIPNGGSPLGM
jgi:hypothetical protein